MIRISQRLVAILFLLLIFASPTLIFAFGTDATISTVAGTGSAGFNGDNQLATTAHLNSPTGVAVDKVGNFYVAEFSNHRIRKVISPTGIITTVAGTGSAGFSGDGGLATAAQLNSPIDVTVDDLGNLYIVEVDNHRIRKVISPTGIITTVAGTGSAGFSGDGGLATAAQLNSPVGVTVDDLGNFYIAEQDNHRIRKVISPTGIITTVAGTGSAGFSGDGGLATAAQLNIPSEVAIDTAGNLYITDFLNHRIRKVISPTGIITTVAGTGSAGYSGDGNLATAAQLNGPSRVVVDESGNLYITDRTNHRIRKVISSTGLITTVVGTGSAGFSGDGGLAIAAQLNSPIGLALDSLGSLYFTDASNQRVRKVSDPPGPPGTSIFLPLVLKNKVD